MKGEGVDERPVAVPVGGVNDHARWFVDDHHVVVFVADVERNILRNGRAALVLRPVTGDFDGDEFSGAEFVVNLYPFAVHQDGAGLDAVLHPVAADFGQFFGQELVDADGLLAGVDQDFLGLDVVYGVLGLHGAKVGRFVCFLPGSFQQANERELPVVIRIITNQLIRLNDTARRIKYLDRQEYAATGEAFNFDPKDPLRRVREQYYPLAEVGVDYIRSKINYNVGDGGFTSGFVPDSYRVGTGANVSENRIILEVIVVDAVLVVSVTTGNLNGNDRILNGSRSGKRAGRNANRFDKFTTIVV